MENTNSNPSGSQPQSQPEEMKIEQTRKVKVKTINNQIYNLEVLPNV